jgi:hypothetical protein
MRRFFLFDEIFYFNECIYVPNLINLHKDILKEFHDSPWVGHPGQFIKLELLEIRYF